MIFLYRLKRPHIQQPASMQISHVMVLYAGNTKLKQRISRASLLLEALGENPFLHPFQTSGDASTSWLMPLFFHIEAERADGALTWHLSNLLPSVFSQVQGPWCSIKPTWTAQNKFSTLGQLTLNFISSHSLISLKSWDLHLDCDQGIVILGKAFVFVYHTPLSGKNKVIKVNFVGLYQALSSW